MYVCVFCIFLVPFIHGYTNLAQATLPKAIDLFPHVSAEEALAMPRWKEGAMQQDLVPCKSSLSVIERILSAAWRQQDKYTNTNIKLMLSFIYSFDVIIVIHMLPLPQTIVSISVHVKVQYGNKIRPELHIKLGTQFIYGLPMCMVALSCCKHGLCIHMFSIIKATTPSNFLQVKCLIMFCIKCAVVCYIVFSPVKGP